MEDVQCRELFQLRNGMVIMDQDLSDKMMLLKQEHPEYSDGTYTPYEKDERGMSALIRVLYDHEIRYCAEYRSWFVYQDGAWMRDEGGIMTAGKIKDFTRLLTLYCGEIADDSKREGFTKYVATLGDRRIRDRIMKDLQDEMAISATQFDNKPYLVNCMNGTYNLENFTFYEHRWDDFLTMKTAFRHTVNKDVRCRRWENFIDEVTQNDPDKAEYIQKALGYSILGMSNEECMFILHGKTTRNGKSTMLNTIETMLGDYARVTPVGLICKGDRSKDVDGASPTVAALKGIRMTTMAESNEYGKLDEEKIKQFTGGEAITARALYSKPVTFRPQFTIWLSCNDLPIVSDKSLFASERLRVIEFNRHFTQQEQDKHLKDELTTQEAMSGIFNWLVAGYMKYLRTGLVMPDHMMRVIRNYEDDNDLVLQFLRDRCETVSDGTIKAKDLYVAYKSWCRSQGIERVISARKLNHEMERHSGWFTERKRSCGDSVYYGIKMREVVV